MRGKFVNRLVQIYKTIVKIVDVFLLLISPMMILMFIVGVIVMLDRGGSHYRFIQKLNTQSQITTAIIDTRNYKEYGWFLVHFTDKEGKLRQGTLRTKYYPEEVLIDLEKAETVEIRYLDPFYEDDVALAGGLPYVNNYLGFASEPGMIMLISWVLLIIHPEFLYLAYVDDWDKVIKDSFAK